MKYPLYQNRHPFQQKLVDTLKNYFFQSIQKLLNNFSKKLADIFSVFLPTIIVIPAVLEMDDLLPTLHMFYSPLADQYHLD